MFTSENSKEVAASSRPGRPTAGSEVLRGYQTGGYSKSGNAVGWKLFEVAKISGLRETDSIFLEGRPGYNPNDSDMRSVHCCV